MSDADKAFLREKGLVKLAELAVNDSYIAVVQNGEVVYELTGSEKNAKKPISYKGTLPDGTVFRLESGGLETGNTADILVDNASEMSAGKGLNILVYSNELKTSLHTVKFNTANGTGRDVYGMHDIYFLLNEEEFNKEYSPTSIRGKIKTYKAKVDAAAAAGPSVYIPD